MRYNVLKIITKILLLVLIVLSVVFIGVSRDERNENTDMVFNKGNTTMGVGELALKAIDYGESKYTSEIKEQVNQTRSHCIKDIDSKNISREYVLDFSSRVVERFVNVSMQAWLEGDIKTLAVLQYVGWPLKEELHKIPYRPNFNTTELYVTACTLNETLNNIEMLKSLVSGSPRINKEDLAGLLDAWRHSIGYSSIVDVDKYGPQYMGVASKGPLTMINSAFSYTITMAGMPFMRASIGAQCTLEEPVDNTSLARYREEAMSFMNMVSGDPYTYMFFYPLLKDFVEVFDSRIVVDWYNACADQLGGGLNPEDLTYIVFHRWLTYTGFYQILIGEG